MMKWMGGDDKAGVRTSGAGTARRRTPSHNAAGVVCTALACCVSLAAPVAAQDYPSREIRAVSPVAAGSGGDILVRYYSDKLSKLTGKPVVVENKGGAAGVIGVEYAARAKPDGYTILFTPASSMLAAQPWFYKKLSFDPLKDFTSVAPLAWLPMGIAVDAKSGIRTVGDLVEHLKRKPDHGQYGAGSNSGLGTAELFKDMAKLKTLQIPYKSSQQGLTGLISGQIDFLAWDATFLSGHVRAGRVRLVAVTSAVRSSALPDVPTMQESGFPGFEITSWWGVSVPAGTPRPVVDKLNGWLREISAMEETKQFLQKVATEVLTGSPEQMAAMLKRDYENWGRIAKLAKVEPQ